MKNYIKKLSLCIVCSTIYLNAFAQEIPSPSYLYQIGVKDSIYSTVLDEQRDIWIHLPEGGSLKPGVKYPVVYILDGAVQMSALAAVYNYYWGNYLPKMILVGISNQSNRTRDLTSSKVKMRGMETGGAEKFTEFIEQELIPFIDNKYPTTPYRTLIGHSYGGLFAINTLINHRHLFSNYISIDPSLDWDDQKLLKNALVSLQNEDFSGKFLYVALAGPLDRANEAVGIHEVLQSKSEHSILSRSILTFAQFAEIQPQNNLNFSWKYYPDDIHGTVPLPSIMDGLRSQFDWYQLKDASSYNNPETSVEEIEKLIKDRERSLSEHFGYSCPPADEELLTMGGHMFLQMGQMAKAKLFFQLSVKYYPESTNAHQSMAEYYLSQNDKPNAIKHLTEAYELSGNDGYKQKIDELNSD